MAAPSCRQIQIGETMTSFNDGIQPITMANNGSHKLHMYVCIYTLRIQVPS